jgi:hypothetical protein
MPGSRAPAHGRPTLAGALQREQEQYRSATRRMEAQLSARADAGCDTAELITSLEDAELGGQTLSPLLYSAQLLGYYTVDDMCAPPPRWPPSAVHASECLAQAKRPLPVEAPAAAVQAEPGALRCVGDREAPVDAAVPTGVRVHRRQQCVPTIAGARSLPAPRYWRDCSHESYRYQCRRRFCRSRLQPPD